MEQSTGNYWDEPESCRVFVPALLVLMVTVQFAELGAVVELYFAVIGADSHVFSVCAGGKVTLN